MIRMEEDFPSNHPTCRLPILDLEVWMERGIIKHQFYKKPMASRKLVQARSAFSTQQKRSILLAEGMRRLRNCSPELCWKEKVLFLNKFSSDLRYSGHSESFRMTILKRIVGRYRKELSNHLEGKVHLYRSREERETMNHCNRATKQKDTWFRAGGATSTLTVPATPNGLLAEKVRKNLLHGRQPTGTRTKVVENGGLGSRSLLIKSNQFARCKCERNECMLCFQEAGSDKSVKCGKNSVGYEGLCTRCPNQNKYVGETSRTAYTRIKEHLSDYRSAATAKLPPLPDGGTGFGFGNRKKNVKSWMWEHTRDCHGGVVGDVDGRTDYKLSVSGIFKKCLDRQIDEGLRMNECEARGENLLNSKNEYFTPKIVETVFRQQ